MIRKLALISLTIFILFALATVISRQTQGQAERIVAAVETYNSDNGL